MITGHFNLLQTILGVFWKQFWQQPPHNSWRHTRFMSMKLPVKQMKTGPYLNFVCMDVLQN